MNSLPRMPLHMNCQLASFNESLFAVRTFEFLFTRRVLVFDVPHKIPPFDECSLAHGTFVIPLAGMDFDVPFQMTALTELFVA